MKAFRASAKDCGLTRETPHAAAVAFFNEFPSKRKCDVIEGEADGHFFTVRFGRKTEGDWPKSWKGITKKTLIDLPQGGQP